jgi:hypothetical protein
MLIDLLCSEEGQVAGFSKQSNKPSASIKGTGFIDQLCDFPLMK